MSNYNQSTFFAPKDSLSPNDPLKLIKGSEVDPEFSAIAVAMGTKIDTAGAGLAVQGTTLIRTSSNVSAVAIASADTIEFNDSSSGVSNPAKTTVEDFSNFLAGQGLNASSGVIAVDVDGLSSLGSIDAANDTMMVYDASAAGLRKVTVSEVANAASGTVPSSRVLTAGSGLTGGGDLSANRTLAMESGVVAAGTYGSATQVPQITFDTHGRATGVSLQTIQHDSLTGFVSNEHIDHSGVSIVAGTGLSGGGTIAASRTLALDLDELTAVDIGDLDSTDGVPVIVDGVSRKIAIRDAGTLITSAASQTLDVNDANTIMLNSSASTFTVTVPSNATAAIPVGATVGLIQHGSGSISVVAGGGASLTSVDGNNLVTSSGGVAVLIKINTNGWVLAGDLE